MRNLTAILTALCVLLSSAYCACAAGVQSVKTTRAHTCCDHGGKTPAKPGHPHDPARDCPHCDGSAVTAAPQKSQDAQHVTAQLPAFTFDVVFAVTWTPASVLNSPAAHPLPANAGPAPTLLGLHCALTL